jgi:hypothetical protein
MTTKPERYASERDLEAAITEYLQLNRWLVIKTDASESARVSRGRKKYGSISSGTPDLVALRGGQGIAIEVKTHSGVVTPLQQSVHACYNQFHGVPTRVIRSLEELQVWLDELLRQHPTKQAKEESI